ncbi:MAG: hypothetical protein NC320_01975 [Clostridium sp.]|nr:hypothetical protein [Clostridium sp.]
MIIILYLYDNAVCEDLRNSFNPEHVDDPVVKVAAPEQVIGLAAQIHNDEIKFPIVALTRKEDIQIDNSRMNFTWTHKGIQSVLDPKTNNLYYEKVIPIKLAYSLTVLTTNTADMDELIRELLFKYIDMYFLTIKLPYECERKVRFGISIRSESDIERSSGNLEYIESGKLYQSIIPLDCEGCVYVSYTPAHLKRSVYEIEAVLPHQNK